MSCSHNKMDCSCTEIKTNVVWHHKKHGDLVFSNAFILLSEDEIKVSVDLSENEVDFFSDASSSGVGLHAALSTEISYEKCQIEDLPIIIDTSKSRVFHYQIHRSVGHCCVSWKLSNLSYSYRSSTLLEYCIINAPYIYVLFLLGEISNKELNSYYDFYFNFGTYRIQQTNNPDFSEISLVEGFSDNEGLLAMFSLYAKTPIEPVVRYRINEDYQLVDWKPVRHDMEKETLQNYELSYLRFPGVKNLRDFMEQCCWSKKSDSEKSNIKRAIYCYASSKYVDLHLQFLMIYSILDRYTGNSYGKDPYLPMKEKISDYGIDITKIGKQNDKDIDQLGLFLERTSGSKKVVHFCDLRNYILHFMTNKEIDDYLDKGDLVGAMRFAAFIILMHEAGFPSCQFRNEWKCQSILLKKK